jgi:hypothetical protein
MVKPNAILRTRTVSTKLTEEEFAQVEAQAAERGAAMQIRRWPRSSECACCW